MLGLSFWYRVILDRGEDAPPALTALMVVVAAAYAVERVVTLFRVFRRPCRRPVQMSREWFTGPIIIACLLGFGLWGLFDSDPTNQWISLAMFATGVVSLALLASWKTKPICSEDE